MLLFGFAPMLASTALSASRLAFALRIVCLTLCLDAMNGVQLGALTGLEAFRSTATANLIRGLASVPIVATSIYFGHFPGAMWGLLGVSLVGFIATHLFLRQACKTSRIPVRYRPARDNWQLLWGFSLPAFMCSALLSPVVWITNTMLVNGPGGYAEMGIFTAASQWRNALNVIPAVIGGVSIPMLSSLQASGNWRAARKVLGASVLLNAVCAMPIFAALALFSGRVMGLYGAGFAKQADVLIITAMTAFLLAIESPVGHLMIADGKMWLGAAMNTAQGLALLLTAGAMAQFGLRAKGLAGAYLISYLANGCWTLWYVLTVLKRPHPDHAPRYDPRAGLSLVPAQVSED